MSSFSFHINSSPIRPETGLFDSGEGAEAQFLGAVRGTEDGRPISGIDYTAYLPMAERTLAALCERGQKQHGPHRVEIHHRLGFVPAREPGILIRVKTKHSAEAFDLCRGCLQEVKTSLPVWKRPVFL